MKKFYLGIVVLAVGVVLIVVDTDKSSENLTSTCDAYSCSTGSLPVTDSPPNKPSPVLQSQTDEVQTQQLGPVSVTITPKVALAATEPREFDIVLETHTYELVEDLTKVSSLTDSSGKQYLPLSWEGDLPGGHHRSGSLRFPPIDSDSVTLTLRVADGEGIFIWNK